MYLDQYRTVSCYRPQLPWTHFEVESEDISRASHQNNKDCRRLGTSKPTVSTQAVQDS